MPTGFPLCTTPVCSGYSTMDHASAIPIPQDLEPDQEVMLKNLQGGELGFGPSSFLSSDTEYPTDPCHERCLQKGLACFGVPAVNKRLASSIACPFDWPHQRDDHAPPSSFRPAVMLSRGFEHGGCATTLSRACVAATSQSLDMMSRSIQLFNSRFVDSCSPGAGRSRLFVFSPHPVAAAYPNSASMWALFILPAVA